MLSMVGNVLVCKLEGTAAAKDLLETHVRIFSDFNYNPEIFEYWDVSGITEINIPYDEYEKLIFDIRKVRTIKPAKKALYAETDLQHGMARSYYSLAGDLYGDYDIFKDLDSAAAYLNLPVEKITFS